MRLPIQMSMEDLLCTYTINVKTLIYCILSLGLKLCV